MLLKNKDYDIYSTSLLPKLGTISYYEYLTT